MTVAFDVRSKCIKDVTASVHKVHISLLLAFSPPYNYLFVRNISHARY